MSSTPYDRQISFALYSAENPTVPHSGADLDAEFNAVKVSLDDTQQNLALLQDDDGALKRGSVGQAQFDSSVSLGFGPPTLWESGVDYVEDVSTVFHTNIFYIATEDHTSGDTFDASKWSVLADFTASTIIPDNSLPAAKLVDGTIPTGKIADGAISTPKLASQAVATTKIADHAVTLTKLAATIPTEIANIILPVGFGPLPWFFATPPPGWDWADGVALLPDTNFVALRAALISNGFPFGQDGSANPKKPDARGRAVFCADDLGTAAGAASRLTSATIAGGAVIGGFGGAQTVTLSLAQLPTGITSNAANSISVTSTVANVLQSSGAPDNFTSVAGSTTFNSVTRSAITSTNVSQAIAVTSNNTGGTAFNNMPPALVCTMIIKAH